MVGRWSERERGVSGRARDLEPEPRIRAADSVQPGTVALKVTVRRTCRNLYWKVTRLFEIRVSMLKCDGALPLIKKSATSIRAQSILELGRRRNWISSCDGVLLNLLDKT